MKEKKEFTKAEVEVIRFEKNDIITQSPGNDNTGFTEIEGTGANPGNLPGPPPSLPGFGG